jgi:excisionase family DNA binding protein
LSISTIRRLIDDGTLDVIRLRGRVLIDARDIERLIEQSRAS